MLRLEHGDEVLVTELVGRAEVLGVPRTCASRTIIDLQRPVMSKDRSENVVLSACINEFFVPLVSVRRNLEDAEINEDAELRTFKPVWDRVVLLERRPRWLDRPRGHRGGNLFDRLLHDALIGFGGHIEPEAVPPFPEVCAAQTSEAPARTAETNAGASILRRISTDRIALKIPIISMHLIGSRKFRGEQRRCDSFDDSTESESHRGYRQKTFTSARDII